MRIPRDEEIHALHEKYAPTREAFDLVYTHCAIVCAIAERPAGRGGLDADKFHSKTTPPTFVTADTYAADVRRFGRGKVATFLAMREEFGEPDLRALIATYGHAVR
jgi:hypothetical protein